MRASTSSAALRRMLRPIPKAESRVVSLLLPGRPPPCRVISKGETKIRWFSLKTIRFWRSVFLFFQSTFTPALDCERRLA